MKLGDRKACGRIHTDNCFDAAKSLLDAFTWDNSPEGRAFWANIYERLMDLSFSPDAEYKPLNASEQTMQTNDMTHDEDVRLSTVQQGDVAVLRCGGECEVDSVTYKHNAYHLRYKGFDLGYVYSEEGFFNKENHLKKPIDIIAIKRKPFDWSQVKPGVAFLSRRGEVVHYIGPDLKCNEAVIVGKHLTFSVHFYWPDKDDLDCIYKCDLIRAPEHDVEVE